jgi:hypothetical protein
MYRKNRTICTTVYRSGKDHRQRGAGWWSLSLASSCTRARGPKRTLRSRARVHVYGTRVPWYQWRRCARLCFGLYTCTILVRCHGTMVSVAPLCMFVFFGLSLISFYHERAVPWYVPVYVRSLHYRYVYLRTLHVYVLYLLEYALQVLGVELLCVYVRQRGTIWHCQYHCGTMGRVRARVQKVVTQLYFVRARTVRCTTATTGRRSSRCSVQSEPSSCTRKRTMATLIDELRRAPAQGGLGARCHLRSDRGPSSQLAVHVLLCTLCFSVCRVFVPLGR